MKITQLLVSFAIIIMIFGCSQAEQASEDASYAPEQYTEYEEEYTETTTKSKSQLAQNTDFKQIEPEGGEQLNQTKKGIAPEAVERKLIKNGRIGFQTDDLGKTHQRVISLSKKYKAYIASDETIKRYDQTEHNITVRIPADKFDNFLADVGEGVKEFDYKEINSQDVTAEYLDLQARIKTKKELESRYLQILQKANTVTDMLEVERQLGEVRGEIESMEGRLKYLKNQVSFSTLNISFYKEVPYKGDSFVDRLGKGFGEGWQGLLMFIVGLTYIWPFLILFGLAVFIIRRFWKKRKQGMIIKK